MSLRKITCCVRIPRRPRFQYGLRSLLLVTFVVCLALGWYLERVGRQRQAVAVLKKLGANVKYYDSHDYDSAFRRSIVNDIWAFETPPIFGERIERLMPERVRQALGADFFRPVDSLELPAEVPECCGDLHGVRYLTLDTALDEDLFNIGMLRDLKRLYIGNSLITDASMPRLGGLQKLKCLELHYWGSRLPRGEQSHYTRWQQQVTDAGLAHLAGLRKLKQLSLNRSAVSDAGLAHLAGMADLQVLELKHTRVTDSGMVHLAGMPKLMRLDLSGTVVGDDGLPYLAKLPDMDALSLNGTLVTGDGLSPLSALKKLRFLDLRGTAMTENGLHALGEITSLKYLYLDSMTPEGDAWLAERLPQAEVVFDDPGNIGLNRARLLMNAGLWRQALTRLHKLDAEYLMSVAGLAHLGRCYAELGEWSQAESAYRKALEKGEESTQLWEELTDWPSLFERLARLRPNDIDCWITSARIAVLQGRWSDAVSDYARAIECSPALDSYTDNRSLEYGISLLLSGASSEHRRFCSRLVKRHQQSLGNVKNNPAHAFWILMGWDITAARLWFMAPQGAVDAFQLVDWGHDELADREKFRDLLPLMYCRAGKFQNAVRQNRIDGGHDGRLLFSRAIAYHYLGEDAQARESFQRGEQWLSRFVNLSLRRGDFYFGAECLEAEVLRREAERSIYRSQ